MNYCEGQLSVCKHTHTLICTHIHTNMCRKWQLIWTLAEVFTTLYQKLLSSVIDFNFKLSALIFVIAVHANIWCVVQKKKKKRGCFVLSSLTRTEGGAEWSFTWSIIRTYIAIYKMNKLCRQLDGHQTYSAPSLSLCMTFLPCVKGANVILNWK